MFRYKLKIFLFKMETELITGDMRNNINEKGQYHGKFCDFSTEMLWVLFAIASDDSNEYSQFIYISVEKLQTLT